MPKIECVLATLNYESDRLEQIKKACNATKFIHVNSRDTERISTELRNADVALLSSDLDDRFLNAPQLKWVHCDHAGLNKSAKPDVFKKGLLVTGSAGRSSPALAEHAIFFMLSLTYNSFSFYKAQEEHHWGIPGQENLRGLYGRTLGIIGLGHTGKELALRAKAFRMKVLGYRRHADSPVPGVDEIYYADRGDQLSHLIPQCDFLVLAVPLSDATFHMIGKKELQLLKPSSFLINMARGPVIDQDALIEALNNREIAGAGLDTTTPEPLPYDDILWDTPGVIITPHVTPQVPDRTGRSLEIILENIKRYQGGEPLRNQLMPEDVLTRNLRENKGKTVI